MSSPSNLNEFATVMDQATEIYKKLTICEALVSYLKNPHSDLSIDEHGPFCLNLIQWMTSPSLKISLKALEAALAVLERMPHVFKPYVSSCFPALVERYADSKELVRNKVHQVLLGFVDKEIMTSQGLHERLLQHGYQHKNSVVRVESLKCLMNILVMHGANSLQLSGSTSVFLKLYSDQSEIVREEAANTLVEVYRQVGEKLRINIRKSYSDQVPPQRLAALFAKFDNVREPTSKFQSSSGDLSISRAESSEDVNDGQVIRKTSSIISKIPSASHSRRASTEDLSKKSALDSRKGLGTLGRNRSAARNPTSNQMPAGAVDEASFRQAFLDIPSIQIYTTNELRDALKLIATSIGNADEDWEKRVEAFRKIRSVATEFGDHAEFPEMIKKLEVPIMDALKDLRSQVVREACITIAFLAERFKTKFVYFAEFLFSNLVALIQNSAKVISTSALVAIRFIVENTYSVRMVSLIVNNLSSKSKDIRRAMCEILCIVLSNWPVTTLEKKHPELRSALQKGIGDADPEARQLARKAFCEYKSKFPDRADDLLRTLDSSYRRMLSEGSTESVNALANTARTGSARKVPLPVPKTPVLKRSNTAVDAQAVQRASVRSQYAAMHRLKVTATSATANKNCRSPNPIPTSMTKSTVGMLDDGNSRSRPRAPRYSRSQPTSRSASPSAQFNYHTFQSANRTPFLPRPSGIPGPRSCSSSQETSRDTSPTRFGPGAIPKARKRLVATGLQQLPLTQKMLQQSREAEYALANAFMRGETDGQRAEKSSDESETSSLCDRSSCRPPSTPYLMDVTIILDYLDKSDWTDRKNGLFSLKHYLAENALSPSELQRVTESFTRMFMNSQTKVYTLFLDTLSALIQRHWQQLDYWLYVLFHKLFTKLGTDVLPTIEKKILNVLSFVRETFPYESQLRDTFRFIVDPIQMHNTKVKIHVVKHLSHLCSIIADSKQVLHHFQGAFVDQTASVLSRLVRWSEVPELKEYAHKCIANLFHLNAPLISSVMPQLTSEEQVVVDHIVKSSLQIGSSSRLQSSSENDEITKSLQITSQEIQTYKFDGLSQDSGICPFSPMSPTHKFNLDERLSPSPIPSKKVESNCNSDNLRSSQKFTKNGSTEIDSGSCINPNWAQLFDILQPESNNKTEAKKEALLTMADLVKDASTETISPYVIKIVKRLVFIMSSFEGTDVSDWDMGLMFAAFRCLDRLLSKRGIEAQFAPFHELLALKTMTIIKSRPLDRVVMGMAEECIFSMVQVFPVPRLLEIFLGFALDSTVKVAYTAIKGIQELIQAHSKEEFDPHFNQTMSILLMAFNSDHSAIRKAVVFCLVAIHSVYGEAEMSPYLKRLDSSKRKLLDVYIQRQNKESK